MTERERCSRCGRTVDPEDGFRLWERPGARKAVFCRLEHVFPWAFQGPHWEAGEPDEGAEPEQAVHDCALCREPLGDVRLLLVRHRGEHRIPDGFCSVDHLAEWAKGGGRWR